MTQQRIMTVAMDRIYYQRMLSVSLSDMRVLAERNPSIWQFFLDGHFSVQINQIPRPAKGLDHAGEQKNKKKAKKLKIQSGLIDICDKK